MPVQIFAFLFIFLMALVLFLKMIFPFTEIMVIMVFIVIPIDSLIFSYDQYGKPYTFCIFLLTMIVLVVELIIMYFLTSETPDEFFNRFYYIAKFNKDEK